uniref:Uncharacterized protein n=1 Tax=Brassica campestris TaxID=3711 RepID=M4FER9_BRACM
MIGSNKVEIISTVVGTCGTSQSSQKRSLDHFVKPHDPSQVWHDPSQVWNDPRQFWHDPSQVCDTPWIERRPVWFMDTAQGGVLVYQLDQTEVFMSDYASPTARVIPSDHSVHADHNFPDRADQTVRPDPSDHPDCPERASSILLLTAKEPLGSDEPGQHFLVSLVWLAPTKRLFLVGPVFEEEPLDYPHQGRRLDTRNPMDEDLGPIFDEEDEPGPVFDEEATSITSILDLLSSETDKTWHSLRSILDNCVVLSLDDIVVYNTFFEKHLESLIVNSHYELKLVCSDVEQNMHVLKMNTIAAYLDKILVCDVYFDVHLDKLKCVLLVLEKDILVFDLNKYLSCIFDLGLLVFVLSIRERQIQPLRNESIDRAQQPEIWRSFVVQTGYLGDDSDMGSVHNGYLNIQKFTCLMLAHVLDDYPKGLNPDFDVLRIEKPVDYFFRRFDVVTLVVLKVQDIKGQFHKEAAQCGVHVYQLDQTEFFMSDYASPTARVFPSDHSVHADHNFPDRADQTVRPDPSDHPNCPERASSVLLLTAKEPLGSDEPGR